MLEGSATPVVFKVKETGAPFARLIVMGEPPTYTPGSTAAALRVPQIAHSSTRICSGIAGAESNHNGESASRKV
jgi:hypothetical protein